MRRILICNYEFPPLGGGGSSASWFLARELVRRGHDVEVITSAFRGYPRSARRGRFRLTRVPVLRAEKGQSNPIEMLCFVVSAGLRLLLRRGARPDAIVSFHSIPSGLAAFPYAMTRGIPHIVLFRGGDVPGWLPGELDFYHRATLWLNRLIVYRAALALANSDGLRDLASRSFPRREIGVLPNGVDPRAFRPPEGGRRGREGPVRLLFLGRITTQKGIDTMIRVLGSPELRGLNWHLDIAGSGPRADEYSQLAQRLGLLPRISFLGWLDREHLRRLYDAADVLVFPSRWEGMPNVVLEAAACGLPVIGTRVAGTEEIVRDGETGYLVEVDDEGALRERIGRLIGDEELRLRMGERAREMVVRDWSWAARARQLEELIEELAEAESV